MTIHDLKIDLKEHYSLRDGTKRFEIRKNDRNFQAGDILHLKATLYTGAEMAEGKPLQYTGEEMLVKVSQIIHGPIYGLAEGWCIMSVIVLTVSLP